jgi:aspartyl-tRNA(Asn)/glutamyl-tRNA(Gln) amidotransferase subunit C
MKVDNELISNLETLAKLRLSVAEKEQLSVELEKIIDMFSMISAVNTDDVEPLIHINDVENVLREDIEGQHLNINEYAKNAPKMLNNMFAVPKVIEQ